MATPRAAMMPSDLNIPFDTGAKANIPRPVSGDGSLVNVSAKESPIFRIDMCNQCLWRLGESGEDERILLKPKSFAILRYLIEHAGRLVTQDELLDAVWPDTQIQPEVLKRIIFDVRDTLGDDPKSPIYIETLPRRGYRFLGGIEREVPRFRSLAVLPLKDLSHDPEQEYFADGLTEALITTLAKIGRLRVISRTSSILYKDASKPVSQIARELGVDTIVEGTVFRAGTRVRITAQLIDARQEERHLWAESYERDLSDVLPLQAELAQAIACKVQVRVSPQEQTDLAQTKRVDPEAYDAYLKGRYALNACDQEGHKRAVQYFHQAIAKDPAYVTAYTGLADALSTMALWGVVPPQEGCGRAKDLALRALDIDASLSEAHTSLAWAIVNYDYDFIGAEMVFEQAIELNPRNATAHRWFGMALGMMGQHERAYTELKLAHHLDPRTLMLSGVNFVSWCAHQYDRAIEECQRILELDPNCQPAYLWLGLSYVAKSAYEPGIAALKRALQIGHGTPNDSAILGEAYAAAGLVEEAQKILRELLGRQHVTAYMVGKIYAALGETDQALRWLEIGCREHAEWMTLLKVDPRWDSLRDDVRFRNVMRIMKFPELIEARRADSASVP